MNLGIPKVMYLIQVDDVTSPVLKGRFLLIDTCLSAASC